MQARALQQALVGTAIRLAAITALAIFFSPRTVASCRTLTAVTVSPTRWYTMPISRPNLSDSTLLAGARPSGPKPCVFKREDPCSGSTCVL